jgi:hypothetical protein
MPRGEKAEDDFDRIHVSKHLNMNVYYEIWEVIDVRRSLLKCGLSLVVSKKPNKNKQNFERKNF